MRRLDIVRVQERLPTLRPEAAAPLQSIVARLLASRGSYEPDRRIYRIRLSDKTSRLRPRRAATKLGQAYEPEVLVKGREWIESAPCSPDFLLVRPTTAQPHNPV